LHVPSPAAGWSGKGHLGKLHTWIHHMRGGRLGIAFGGYLDAAGPKS